VTPNIQLIFEKENETITRNFVPKMDIEQTDLNQILPENLQRKDLLIPNIPEIEIVRHFIKLSYRNYGVDNGIYPLGSCTMKYNPKVNETIAKLSGFTHIHPLQEENQGCLELIHHISKQLGEITGMDQMNLEKFH